MTFCRWDKATVIAEHSVATELMVNEAPLYFDRASCAAFATFAHQTNNDAIDRVILRKFIAMPNFKQRSKIDRH